jgi:hypothetical protein
MILVTLKAAKEQHIAKKLGSSELGSLNWRRPWRMGDLWLHHGSSSFELNNQSLKESRDVVQPERSSI